ncbi:hypothetical protein [Caldithrix abyssi]
MKRLILPKRMMWGVLLLACWLAAAQSLFAQSEFADSSRSLNPYTTTLKSALLPGWGQVNQERLWEGAVFYFGSLHFYYNAFFHLYHYNKGKARRHYHAFRWNLNAALFVHLVNVLDAADVSFRKRPTGWQGGLFSDKPLKSPRGAALRSAMVPGWGQFYTESYLKGLAFALTDIYLAFRAHQADINYRSTRETKYRDERSKFSWYLGAAYLLTVADAYASAYLYKFDQAMKLTVVPVVDSKFVGFHAQIKF